MLSRCHVTAAVLIAALSGLWGSTASVFAQDGSKLDPKPEHVSGPDTSEFEPVTDAPFVSSYLKIQTLKIIPPDLLVKSNPGKPEPLVIATSADTKSDNKSNSDGEPDDSEPVRDTSFVPTFSQSPANAAAKPGQTAAILATKHDTEGANATGEATVKIESKSTAAITVKAEDKKAEEKKPEAPTPAPTSAPSGVTKSNRDSIDDDELESVYQPATIEGYAGWKKNKVRKEQLIDNDIVGISDRWRIGLQSDSRHTKGNFWNPYRQNMLKGDYPIVGQSLFLNTNFISDTVAEAHSTPTPSGVSTRRGGKYEFFGQPDQYLVQQNFEISLEFFKGETDFKPREWEIRVTPVFNLNYTHVQENFAINIDPREGHQRVDHQIAFQELFGEYHFRDLSPNYDFISSRTGVQFFNEDFRGFLFADNEPGARIFGNLEANRLQYNLAYFEMLDKDTNSGLNTFTLKNQHVILANLIRQDCFIKGYNMIANLAFNDEESSVKYNQNGVIVRPAPIGNLAPHSNKVYYVGFGGDGHIGRVNVTHQVYQALGEDSNNNLAGKSQKINAQMAALELSYDMDWMRFKASGFYASGDKKTFDNTAGGFDSIFDDPNFAGGGFSWWSRQGGFGAGNALTQLKSRSSLLPNLNTSKGEGQRNFVNPGLHLYNVGYDADLTQNLKALINVNYLQFDNTSSLEELLHQNNIHKNIGLDYSMGIAYRPFLNNQVVINGGVSALTPSQGFKDIYSRQTLYAGFLGVTVKY